MTRRWPGPRDAPGDADALWRSITTQVTEQRRARTLSQSDLADLCGTTQSAIARLESGVRPPKLDTLLRVAQALDCELVVTLRPRTTIEGEPA